MGCACALAGAAAWARKGCVGCVCALAGAAAWVQWWVVRACSLALSSACSLQLPPFSGREQGSCCAEKCPHAAKGGLQPLGARATTRAERACVLAHSSWTQQHPRSEPRLSPDPHLPPSLPLPLLPLPLAPRMPMLRLTTLLAVPAWAPNTCGGRARACHDGCASGVVGQGQEWGAV